MPKSVNQTKLYAVGSLGGSGGGRTDKERAKIGAERDKLLKTLTAPVKIPKPTTGLKVQSVKGGPGFIAGADTKSSVATKQPMTWRSGGSPPNSKWTGKGKRK